MSRIRTLLTVVFAFAAITLHAGSNLTDYYVAEDAAGLICIDVKKLRELPQIEKVITNIQDRAFREPVSFISKSYMEEYLESLRQTIAATPAILKQKTPIDKDGLVWGIIDTNRLKSLFPEQNYLAAMSSQFRTGAFAIRTEKDRENNVWIRA